MPRKSVSQSEPSGEPNEKNEQASSYVEPASSEPEKPKKRTSKKTSQKETSKPLKSESKPLKETESFWERRKMEVYGLSIVALSLFFIIAIFSYNKADDQVIENIRFYEVFGKTARLAAEALENPLGIIGAMISSFLVNSILGYPTAILMIAITIWGWSMFRKNGYDRAISATIYTILFSLLIGTLFGLTKVSNVWSGNIGRLFANLLSSMIGDFGAWAFVLISIAITLVLYIDLDLQKTADRLVFIFQRNAVGAKMKFKEWYAEREAARVAESNDEARFSGAESQDPLDLLAKEEEPEIDSHQLQPPSHEINPSLTPQLGLRESEIPISNEPTHRAEPIEISLSDLKNEQKKASPKELEGGNRIPSSDKALPEDFGFRYKLKEEENRFVEKISAVRLEAEKLQAEKLEAERLKNELQETEPKPTENSTQTTIQSETVTPNPLISEAATPHNRETNERGEAQNINQASVPLVVKGAIAAAAAASSTAPETTAPVASLAGAAAAAFVSEKKPHEAQSNQPKPEESNLNSTGNPSIPNEFVKDENEQKSESSEPLIDASFIIPTNKLKEEFPKSNQELGEDEDLIDEIISSKKNLHEPLSPESLELTVKETIEETPADLDERELEVETRERVPYQFPSVDLLIEGDESNPTVTIEELETNKRRLLEKLKIYKIEVVRVEATVGPRVTLFELELAPDVKISRIVTLADDIAMAMAAKGIRIIAPIPGKNAVGVEIPNAKTQMVRIKSVLQSEKFKNSTATLPIVFGKTISNEIFIDDLAKMPHLLIAGATGSGKSVGINNILTSLIYHCSPDQVKFLLIDPKRVELFPYQKLKNHFLVKYRDLDEQIITDTSKAVYALKSIEKEMDRRYERMQKGAVRHIKDFNVKFPSEALPFVVVVIDELADLMITAGKDVEEPIARLAQLARAVGIHLVVATQRPSVDVITGVIKANFPARMAYQVSSKIDSRTILDGPGADQLLGNGDLLYQPATEPKPIRIQNAYVSTEEVERITDFIYNQDGVEPYLLPAPDLKLGSAQDDDDDLFGGKSSGERDKMFEEAARLVVRHQMGSVSLLQRRLKLGFGRAARIVDQLEEAGIVGSPDGTKARQVLIQDEASLELLLNNLE
ncbi:MAG: DNA translocase FtsK [Chloroherpetonaceae bacterium]|nr:DNA translocase FtsK [Chloroherpetonaceae bacterium]